LRSTSLGNGRDYGRGVKRVEENVQRLTLNF